MSQVVVPVTESLHQAGDEISLPCEAEGYPEPSVRWMKNNAGLPQSNRILVDSLHTLTIKRASPIGKTTALDLTPQASPHI